MSEGKPKCTWRDCKLEGYAKNLCRIHYTRQVRKSNMDRPFKAAAGTVSKFLPTVRISEEVETALSKAANGYGISTALLIRRIVEDWTDSPVEPTGHDHVSEPDEKLEKAV